MHGAKSPLTPHEDLYEVLRVDRGASRDQVRQAYRRLARTCHPDLGGEAAGGERFRRLAAAYEILGDQDRRASYDAERRRRAGSGGPVPSHRAPRPSGRAPSAPRPVAHRPPVEAEIEEPPSFPPLDEWRVVSVLGRFVAAAMLMVVLAVGVLAIAAASRDAEPAPGPTIFCRTPDGWLDCRRAFQPSFP